MVKTTHSLYIIIGIMLVAMAGCTGGSGENSSHAQPKRQPQPSDTLYTQEKALDIYDYQPLRALQILDSAVVVNHVDEVTADILRAKIYAWTVMGAQVDSLLHGSDGVRYDSARALGERLLENDSVKASLERQQKVLEVLTYAARQQKDTARFLRRSQELVAVCHAQGAETEALRSEAEVGAALYGMGKRAEGLARIDSVIRTLSTPLPYREGLGGESSREGLGGESSGSFNELDALIIALKRKIIMLSNEGKYVETIPLARRIIDSLTDYEQHPTQYHDGSNREPEDSTARADYIHFYRTQAQSAITAAYAFLGEQSNMDEAYAQIEHSVREATAREHIARYHALEQQMLREKAESRRHLTASIANLLVVVGAILLLFSIYIYRQNRKIKKKNHALAKLIQSLTSNEPAPSSTPKERKGEPLFIQIDNQIRTERLYADANFQRQDICERFNIRREVLNQLISDYTDTPSFPAYINGIRLSEACRLLSEEPSKTVNAIAEEVGLLPRNLRRLFVERYGITPTEYRQGLQDS